MLYSCYALSIIVTVIFIVMVYSSSLSLLLSLLFIVLISVGRGLFRDTVLAFAGAAFFSVGIAADGGLSRPKACGRTN